MFLLQGTDKNSQICIRVISCLHSIMITTISAYNQVFALPTRLLFVSIKHFDEHESDFNDKYLTDHCQLIKWFDKYITLVIIL